jgi:hypothetical protein
MQTRTARIASLIAVLAALAAVIPLAVGAAIPRPIPLAPKNKASLPAGKTPLFKVRSTGDGTVWIHVSKSARKGDDGVIGSDALIAQAHKKRGIFQLRPKFYNYPGFWANTKRKWYWQSYRIACGEEESESDCKVEGPVRTFKLH